MPDANSPWLFRGAKERIPPSYKPFAQVVEQLRLEEMDRRYRQKLRSVVDNLKTRYVVEVHPQDFTLPEG